MTDAASLQRKAKEEDQTEVGVWPEEGETEDEFMLRCHVEMDKCVGEAKAEEVCSTKWEESEKLGKKGFIIDLKLLSATALIAPCGKACVACAGADAPWPHEMSVQGRAATAVFFDDDHQPVEREHAKFAQVTFRDQRGGGIHLATQAASAPFQGIGWRIINTWERAYDESEHPRDEHGRWTDAGGGGGSGSSAEGSGGKLDPKVVQVGGDKWNQETALKLETEYQEAKPQLEKLATDAVSEKPKPEPAPEPEPEEEEEEDTYFEPEEWDQLSGGGQEYVKEQYVKQTSSSYYDSEVQNYYDSGSALDDAKSQVNYEFNNGEDMEWAEEAIATARSYFEASDKPVEIPYTTEQLIAAITTDYQSGYEGKGDFSVTFDDDKLQEPSNLTPEQGTLPGIEPVKPHEQLTDRMREVLEKELSDAFDEHSEKKSSDMEAPDYLSESAKEYAEEDWENNLSDAEKFKWAEQHTSIVEDETTGDKPKEKPSPTSSDSLKNAYFEIEALPETYDPLNETEGTDYRRTQALARYLSVQRAYQVLKSRDLIIGSETEAKTKIKDTDYQLWDSWKSSSTSIDGKLLQLATADELGGRLFEERGINRFELTQYANREFKEIGGYAGVRAYVRAKWEVTQYLLDKAGKSELALYRGVRFDQEILDKRFKQTVDLRGNYKLLPNMHVARNGAASTTTDRTVANDWVSESTGVVLRALMPRTAAVSIPAYGINMKSEHEVVVAGTAWKGWDAWRGKAPTFDEVKLAA